MGTPQSRSETAEALRVEAQHVLVETGLFALLADNFGEPSVTGSAGYDLMVWRDIDIHMAVEPDRWREWMDFGGKLADLFLDNGLGLYSARYTNAYVDAHPLGAGLYWEIAFRDAEGHDWTVDLHGWDPFDYAVRQARDFSLRTDLKGADRDLILRLKTEARERPDYFGLKVTSWDIYQFAIQKAGTSLGDLEKWKKTQ
jgi:hypothetical protein